MVLPVVEFLLSGFTDNSDNALASGKVYSYEPGTTTDKALYTDKAGTSAASNPVTLDANGRTQVYAKGAYKLVLKTAAGTTLYTFDNLFFASNYATTQAEITALNALGSEIVVETNITLTSSLTITAPIRFLKGGKITTAGYTFTINGPLVASATQIFSAASGEVVFGTTSTLQVLPEWFGALGDGSTNDTTAVQVALNAAATAKIPLVAMCKKTYRISSITVPRFSRIESDNARRSYAVFQSNSASAMFVLPSAADCFITFRGILFDGSTTAASCVDLNDSQINLFEDCAFLGGVLQIDSSDGAIWTYINRCEFNATSGTTTSSIKISGDTIAMYISECTFGGTCTNCIVSDSSWTGDFLCVSDCTFGNTSTDIIKLERSSGAGGNVHFSIHNNRFDGGVSNSNINIGRYCYGSLVENSCTGSCTASIICDGQYCFLLDNFISEAVTYAISITSNAQDCYVGRQKWGSLASAATIRVNDAGSRTFIHTTPTVSGTKTTIVSSTTETDIASVTIPAGTLCTRRRCKITVRGELTQNSGGANGVTFKGKLDGTTQITDTTLNAISSGGNVVYAQLEFLVQANDSAAAQSLFWLNANARGTTGVANQTNDITTGAQAATIDMSADRIFKITAQLSASHASLKWVNIGYEVEYL